MLPTTSPATPLPVAPIAFRSVSKSFGTVRALDDVTFDAKAGRVTGLLGRNGAGKSTLMRILLGLVEPTTGEARVAGCPISELPGAPALVGAALGDMTPLPGATGRRELTIWARALGLDDGRVADVVREIGLADAIDRKSSKYSTGMRQRLAIGCALLARPDILVLDEPTSGLDPDGIRWVRRLMRSHAEAGGTVFVSSHHLAEVENTVDDVVVLDRDVKYVGPIEDLAPPGQLERTFFELVEATA